MKLSTLALTTLALSLTNSSLIAGSSAGKADAKGGASSSTGAGLSGELQSGESAMFEYQAQQGRVRIEATVERGMELQITDMKGRHLRDTVVYSEKPRKIELKLDEPTRLRITVRQPAGPFHHLPARASRAQKQPEVAQVSAFAIKIGPVGSASSDDMAQSRGPSAGSQASKKGGLKSSAQ